MINDDIGRRRGNFREEEYLLALADSVHESAGNDFIARRSPNMKRGKKNRPLVAAGGADLSPHRYSRVDAALKRRSTVSRRRLLRALPTAGLAGLMPPMLSMG